MSSKSSDQTSDAGRNARRMINRQSPIANLESQICPSTDCCVVGGGPAGTVLALMLVRRGVRVTLIERHSDFDRDFRGDTLHAGSMEILDQLGLAERILALTHAKMRELSIHTPYGATRLVNFKRLRTKFPFVTMLPQVEFLEFITAEAKRHAEFSMKMGARVEELLESDGVYRGVRYRSSEGVNQLDAQLIVAADGRFSTLRKLAQIQPVEQAQPVDVVWFRLPKEAGDPYQAGTAYLGSGSATIMLDRGSEWQVAYVILKGSFREFRNAGIPTLQERIAHAVPALAERAALLTDWKQVSMLSVVASRVREWSRPGLLLIGDAAHVMSPVGGVGINYAIQDAVEAANVLADPLRRGRVELRHLREVQRRREWPTRVIQRFQALALERLIASALAADRRFRLPLALRIANRVPGLRDVPARLVAFGVRRARVENVG